MNPTSSLPLALPSRTLRLFARHWLPLAVWYLLGKGLHDTLLEVAAHVNRHNSVVAYSIVATAVLCSLVAYLFMFQCVQRDLPTVWGLRKREAEVDPTVKSPGRRTAREQLRSVGLALLPFLLVYSGWNLFEDDVRSVEYRTWEINPLEASPSQTSFTFWFAGAAVVAWLLVKLFEFITRRTRNPVTALLAAVAEANWMFFALFGVSKLVGAVTLLIGNSLAWHNLSGVRAIVASVAPVSPLRVHGLLDGLGLDFGWLNMVKDPLKDGLLLPIAWLAIAGCCYGREMEDVKGLVDHRRFARFTDRWQQAPSVLRRHVGRFPPAGVREKYYPPLHAVRLLVSSGLPTLLLFCVFYSAIDLGYAVLQETAATVIGPHNGGLFWQEVQPGFSVAVSTVTEALRICLLAATFDMAMSRFTSARARAADTSLGAMQRSEAAPPPVGV